MGSKKSNIHLKSQKGQDILDMNEDQAREHLEKLLWPNGAVCRHCGSVNVYKMEGASVRPGLYRCREKECEKQFTVTVGTIFEDSHLALSKWVKAFHLMASSKKGISALQLQRNLGIGSYKTVWHMAHRIRLAMKCEPFVGALKGDVQVDETYVGADRSNVHHVRKGQQPRKRGRGTDKVPVLALVETGGDVRSMPIANIKAETLRAAMQKCVDPTARIVTDELGSYPKAVAGFSGGHSTVLRPENVSAR